jgi:hypothetical protein
VVGVGFSVTVAVLAPAAKTTVPFLVAASKLAVPVWV